MKTEKNLKDKSKLPELRIELTFNAINIKNTIGILGASEVVSILEGVKDLIEDHMILIYLDRNNAIMGIDAFLHNIEELMRGEANRAFQET